MKFNKSFLFGILSIFTFSSCLNEGLFEESSVETGRIQVSVDLLKNTRAASETDEFPVVIKNSNGEAVKNYAKATDVPEYVALPYGSYVIEANTPGAIQEKMSAPYYKGVHEVELNSKVIEEIVVKCRMCNTCVKINADDILEDVETWELTLRAGDKAVTLKNTDNDNTIYWYLGEDGVQSINGMFKGTTKSGETINTEVILHPSDAEGDVDPEDTHFNGGETIELTFTPSQKSDDGAIEGVTISATIAFEETSQDVTIEVEDVKDPEEETGNGGNGEDPGNNPGGNDENAIVLTLPQPITLSEDNTPAANAGDVTISTSNGLASLMVHVESDNSDMIDALALPAGGTVDGEGWDGTNVDLVNGCEVVGNEDLVKFLAMLGEEITVPSVGAVSYTFPIGKFFEFLKIISGNHKFILEATDSKGNKKSGTVEVTVL